MGEVGEARCPVCRGSGRMSIVEFRGLAKRVVKVQCTACGGVGWVPFIDKTKKSEEVEIPAERADIESGAISGWRGWKNWSKVHYFTEGRSLCGNIRSEKAIKRSTRRDKASLDEKCISCLRMYKELGEDRLEPETTS